LAENKAAEFVGQLPVSLLPGEPEKPGMEGKPGRGKMLAYRHVGWPQLYASLLLLMFFAQGLWLALHLPFDTGELAYLQPRALVLTPAASPVTALIARAGSLAEPKGDPQWPVRLPFLFIGTALGASLWYVSRRLCGNSGGAVALALYTFSPTMLIYSARICPEMVAAWSVFGCIFTSIAVAHTLYAPREVVLWNWKRILLLGTAMGLSAGSHFSTAIMAALGLAFMLYLVPERNRAALAIMGAAVVVASIWFGLLEEFSPAAIQAVGSRDVAAGISRLEVVRHVVIQLLRDGPGFLLLLLSALGTVCVWRRPRFFGTLAPLLAAVLLLVCGVAFPAPGFSFTLLALPFLFVFTAGVWADILQTRLAPIAMAIVLAALAIHAYWAHA